MESILTINNLSIELLKDKSFVPLVKGVSLNLLQNEVVALVGGSGGGKTTIGLSVLRLLPSAMRVSSGEIIFNGRNVFSLRRKEMQDLRGKDIAMVFQEPLSAFNPVFKIGSQIAEVLCIHTSLKKQQIKDKVIELLRLVEIPEAKRIASYYPHQLSGGLRQRAMIAMALAASPKIIIADEPTSNLDVTVQARILELFAKLKRELKISILLITHDLGVVRYLADRVFVLDKGVIVEKGKTEEIFENPQEIFTRKLIGAIKE